MKCRRSNAQWQGFIARVGIMQSLAITMVQQCFWTPGDLEVLFSLLVELHFLKWFAGHRITLKCLVCMCNIYSCFDLTVNLTFCGMRGVFLHSKTS